MKFFNKVILLFLLSFFSTGALCIAASGGGSGNAGAGSSRYKAQVIYTCSYCAYQTDQELLMIAHDKDCRQIEDLKKFSEQFARRLNRTQENKQKPVGAFKCHYCPHSDNDKAAIQDHEKKSHSRKTVIWYVPGSESEAEDDVLPDDEQEAEQVLPAVNDFNLGVNPKKVASEELAVAHLTRRQTRILQENQKTVPCHNCRYCTFKHKNRGVTTRHEKTHLRGSGRGCVFVSVGEPEDDTGSESDSEDDDLAGGGGSSSCRIGDGGKENRLPVLDHTSSGMVRADTFKCTFCQYQAVCKTKLQRHVGMHVGSRGFKCEFCSYNASKKHVVAWHEERDHRSGGSSNSVVKIIIDDDNSSEDDGNEQDAQQYGGGSATPGKEQNGFFACGRCEYTTKIQVNFDRHIDMHLGDRGFKCGICSYNASKRYVVLAHEKNYHNSQQRADVAEDPSKAVAGSSVGSDGVHENSDSVPVNENNNPALVLAAGEGNEEGVFAPNLDQVLAEGLNLIANGFD